MKISTLMWLVLIITVGVSMFLLKYKVQALEEELVFKQVQIAKDRDAVRVLEAEWAYINDQERLQRLSAESLGFVSALNELDCVPSPLSFLKEIEASLVSEGKLAACCPYDWSPAATPLEEWLGGHSQRGQNQGDSASILEALLTPGALPGSLEKLRMIDSEPDIPWSVRVHARNFAEYHAHLVVAQKCDR